MRCIIERHHNEECVSQANEVVIVLVEMYDHQRTGHNNEHNIEHDRVESELEVAIFFQIHIHIHIHRHA